MEQHMKTMAEVVRHFNKEEHHGPFKLLISKKGFFTMYEVQVFGVVILKYGSRPGFYDMCAELNSALTNKLITVDQFLEVQGEARQYLAQNPQVVPTCRKAKNNGR